MKLSNIILSATLALKIISAKSINYEKNDREEIEYLENKDFKYQFHCIDDINGVCDKISGELNTALNDLSNTFEFKQPVVFEAYIFKSSNLGPSYKNLIASTTDVSYVYLKSSNDPNTPPYTYAQALAKQLNTDREVTYKKKDFIIMFNAEIIDYIVTNDPQTSISVIILHEIIHGLGFIGLGGIKNFNKNMADVTSQSELEQYYMESMYFPTRLSGIDSESIDNATTIEELDAMDYNMQSYAPLTIYQKHLVDLNTNERIFDDISFIYRDLNVCFDRFKDQHMSTNQILPICAEELDSETKKKLNEIVVNYYVKNKSTGILTVDNTTMPVQTFDFGFSNASSISHTNSKYIDITLEYEKNNQAVPDEYSYVTEQNGEELLDEDFLMYYHGTFVSREYLLNTVAKNNKHGLIGPGIVSTLKTLGWTEKGEPFSNDLYYVEDDNVPEQNDSKYLIKLYTLSRDLESENQSQNQNNNQQPSVTTTEVSIETPTVTMAFESPIVETSIIETPTATDGNETIATVEVDIDNEEDSGESSSEYN